MKYRILGDLALTAHFGWILFMLGGFFLTAAAFKYKRIFEWGLFRTIHLLGIAYVCLLEVFGRPCPLTLLENSLAAKYDPGTVYPGSFLAYYIGKLVYPDIRPMVLIISTAAIGIFTAAVFIFRPPSKVAVFLRDFRR